MTRISVAMAVYNGEKYIREQVDSILAQLKDNDELVISYNESNDNTWKILESYKSDKRVKIFICKEKGVISNFSNAIKKTNGEYILLADQDDVWNNNKIETVLKVFKGKKCDLVLHNAEYTDSELNDTASTLFGNRGRNTGILSTIIKNSYQGCCMSFKKEVKQYILPIPQGVPMHDQWIGILVSTFGKVETINECLIKYRFHETNTSQNGLPFLKRISSRMTLLVHYCIRVYCICTKGNKRRKRINEIGKL